MGWKKGAGLLLAGWMLANTSFRNAENQVGLCIGVKKFGDIHSALRAIGAMGAMPPRLCLRPEVSGDTGSNTPVSGATDQIAVFLQGEKTVGAFSFMPPSPPKGPTPG